MKPKMLRKCSFATHIIVISHARVPIIKFQHRVHAPIFLDL